MFDPAKAAIVSAGIALSPLMTILGARRLLTLWETLREPSAAWFLAGWEQSGRG